MAKIILNPEKGAPISNVQIKGQILFKDSPFEVDTMRKIENDEVANSLLKLFGFLEVLDGKDEVKSYLEAKKKRAFKCDRCDFASDVEIALLGHKRKHDSEDNMDKELGIEVIADVKFEQEEIDPEELEKRREEAEKKHLESGGIVGGWEDDTPMRGAIMQ